MMWKLSYVSMPMILDGSDESLRSTLAMLDDFSKVSGLRLNDKKTEALWIGASIGNDKILLPGKELKWPKDGKVPWDMDFNRSRTICLFKLQ